MTASERRDQLIDVATRLVDELGFHRVSIEAIAHAAGVTRATVYQHFTDLSQLLEAVIDRETSRALAQVSETTLPDLTEGDPVELMLDSLRAYLNAVQNQPRTWRLILVPPEGAPERLYASIAQGRATVLDRLVRAVEPALDADRGSPDAELTADQGSPDAELTASRESPDAELTARLLSAVSDEYARMVLADPKRFPPNRLLRHARWLLGLASDRSWPHPLRELP